MIDVLTHRTLNEYTKARWSMLIVVIHGLDVDLSVRLVAKNKCTKNNACFDEYNRILCCLCVLSMKPTCDKGNQPQHI